MKLKFVAEKDIKKGETVVLDFENGLLETEEVDKEVKAHDIIVEDIQS
jgi:predicted transcriptional regulator